MITNPLKKTGLSSKHRVLANYAIFIHFVGFLALHSRSPKPRRSTGLGSSGRVLPQKIP
jgi:hypothetical protein